MLVSIKVKDFAIIQEVEIQFKNGLNILSGETGAGKSVLLKSLSLLMGGKASTDSLRQTSEEAVIEGLFDLSKRSDIQKRLHEMGINSPEDDLVVRRVINANGKSRVYINGQLSTLGNLAEIVCPLVEVTGHSAPLIEITGQHESRSLMSKSYHLDILDLYAGAWNQRIEFKKFYEQQQELSARILKIKEESSLRAQKLDFLIFQRDEIQALNLKENEEQILESNYIKLKNSAKTQNFIAQAQNMIEDDEDAILSRLQKVIASAAEIKKHDNEIAEQITNLEQAKILIRDANHQLSRYADKMDSNDNSLNAVEERISQLRKLQKKYGTSVEEILKHLQKVEEEIKLLENQDSQITSLEKEDARLQKLLADRALILHKTRQNAANLLHSGVNDELLDLNMKGLSFEVSVKKQEELNTSGYSEVEFLCKSSKTDAARALAKTASGGELSRILLALKQVIGRSEQSRTYLFDEVDTGVSGETAEKVGRKLKSIATGQQVICVTHLAQVARFADTHFVIQKTAKASGVQMSVKELKRDERVKEIARLISGEEITATSMAHAQQLLGL